MGQPDPSRVDSGIAGCWSGEGRRTALRGDRTVRAGGRRQGGAFFPSILASRPPARSARSARRPSRPRRRSERKTFLKRTPTELQAGLNDGRPTPADPGWGVEQSIWSDGAGSGPLELFFQPILFRVVAEVEVDLLLGGEGARRHLPPVAQTTFVIRSSSGAAAPGSRKTASLNHFEMRANHSSGFCCILRKCRGMRLLPSSTPSCVLATA